MRQSYFGCTRVLCWCPSAALFRHLFCHNSPHPPRRSPRRCRSACDRIDLPGGVRRHVPTAARGTSMCATAWPPHLPRRPLGRAARRQKGRCAARARCMLPPACQRSCCKRSPVFGEGEAQGSTLGGRSAASRAFVTSTAGASDARPLALLGSQSLVVRPWRREPLAWQLHHVTAGC